MDPRIIEGFVWDEANEQKVLNHGLTPEDVESIFDEGPVVVANPSHADRWVALGFPAEPDERFVLVSFEINEMNWARVVTAFEPTGEQWWRLYAKTKGIEG